MAEVNDTSQAHPKSKVESPKKAPRRTSDAKIKQDLDEIVTVKREETTEVVRKVPEDKVQCKEKGFSIQRAWCCLRNRRTS